MYGDRLTVKYLQIAFPGRVAFLCSIHGEGREDNNGYHRGFNSVGDHGFSGRRHPRLQMYR